jgi:GNAT superfamily N-acetyltransferase
MKEFQIRPARLEDCPALGNIIVRATQDAFRGLVPDQCLHWLTPDESAANWARNFKTEQSLEEGDILLVAESHRKEVVGFAFASQILPSDWDDTLIVQEFQAELLSLQVDPPWQRQGIGRRLVSQIAAQLKEKGITNLLVKMLSENPNKGFYEHLGAVQLGTRPYNWEGYETEEILYGWRSMNTLL